jgi:hypothetical protein
MNAASARAALARPSRRRSIVEHRRSVFGANRKTRPFEQPKSEQAGTSTLDEA